MERKLSVIGVSAGREDGNSEILLKEALAAVEEEGIEVRFLRLKDYYIKPCEGCELCTIMLRTGQPSRCKFSWDSDDYKFLMDQIVTADGIILSAPVYNLMPPGYLTTLLNRSHCIGIPWLKKETRKVAATISVGGSDWLSLAAPVLNFTATELLGSQMNLADYMVVGGCPGKGMVALHPEYLERARTLGKNLAAEMGNPPSSERCNYHGESMGACPICHSDLLILREGRLACGICDYCGDPVMEQGKIKAIRWDGGIERTRWSDMITQAHTKGEHPTAETKENGQYLLEQEEQQRIAQVTARARDYLKPIRPGTSVCLMKDGKTSNEKS